MVNTVYAGASAEAVETEVTKPIEEAINQISGCRKPDKQYCRVK